jgi:hypothetical protein
LLKREKIRDRKKRKGVTHLQLVYIKYVEIGCTLVSLATYDSLVWTLKDLDGIGKEYLRK